MSTYDWQEDKALGADWPARATAHIEKLEAELKTARAIAQAYVKRFAPEKWRDTYWRYRCQACGGLGMTEDASDIIHAASCTWEMARAFLEAHYD